MKFIFIMNHAPTSEQLARAAEMGTVVELTEKKLLAVPDDSSLGRDWFSARAAEIIASVGGVSPGDTVHMMGQQQLALAVNAAARARGARLVESVTPRISREIRQGDGTVKKENVFSFAGFRELHAY